MFQRIILIILALLVLHDAYPGVLAWGATTKVNISGSVHVKAIDSDTTPTISGIPMSSSGGSDYGIVAYLTTNSLPVGGSLVIEHPRDPFPYKRRPSFLFSDFGAAEYWPLDENSGSNAGNSVGATPLVLINNPTWAAGHFNNGLTFAAASSQYASAAVSFVNKKAFTIDMWVNRANATGSKNIFSIASSSNASNPFVLLRDSNRTLTYYVGGNYNFTGGVLTDNVWTHLTLTWDGLTYRAYQDGVLQGTYASSGVNQSSATNFYLATGYNGCWSGAIDNVAIRNAAVTAAQISNTETFNQVENWCPAAIGNASNQIQVTYTSETSTTFTNNMSIPLKGTAVVRF